MLRAQQRTLNRRTEIQGIGLHSGRPVKLVLRPAAPNTGIVFVRTDLEPAVEIPAAIENVVDTSLATTLGVADDEGRLVRIGTVEHLMAAIAGLGIDNLRVEVEGPEVPVLDGSAGPFVDLIEAAGIRTQDAYKRVLVIKRPIEVRDGDKIARLVPARTFRVTCTVDFDHPLIRNQRVDLEITPERFLEEISEARTFGFLKDVERMKAAGLALGGSLENAVVIDEFSVLNEGGLRFADEFARHKALDAIGDLALLGMPIAGHLTAVRSGHAMNHRLAEALLADARAYEIVEADPRGATDAEDWGFALPAFGLVDAAA
jgi:UDP-3-O-[3-hydroxymyristoyl] N-acetylglucosamine deacetylase